MGPANSVTYNVADIEVGESDELITLQFKAASPEEKDHIKGAFRQLSEQKIHSIMTNEKNENLKAAFDRIVKKYGCFISI